MSDVSREKPVYVSKEQWLELCSKYNKYCDFSEVEGCTYEQARNYIKNMSVWVPM